MNGLSTERTDDRCCLLAYITSQPFLYEIEAEEKILNIDNHRMSH